MNINSVSCVYFSPTGTTKTIVENIAQGLGADRIEVLDITKAPEREARPAVFMNGLVILAAPVYYGRIPEVAAAYFSRLNAENTAAVLVVVYGNRAYDDALLELHDIAAAGRFVPVAGGTFIGEHSYSSSALPMAHGRPDTADLQKARDFGAAVRKKLEGLKSLEGVPPFTVPGKIPYIEPEMLNMIKKARSAVALTPETDMTKCTRCGLCAEVCPTGAISPDDPSQTDRWRCIICHACVKYCPEVARQMNEPHFQDTVKSLYRKCQGRKEPEFFL